MLSNTRCLLLLGLLYFSTLTASAAVVNATWGSATDVPVTASSYTATGNTVNFTLNFAPATGTNLTVVNNTGLPFISGAFDNLAQGQAVALSYGGVTYNYVAHYYGGTGNDLVLVWANSIATGWGYNFYGQVGDGSTTDKTAPVSVYAAGALAGKTVISISAGEYQSLALCSDGTVAAWGQSIYDPQVNGGATQANVPVAVSAAIPGSALYGKTVVAIASGQSHSLALCSDGTVAGWGDNSWGQLGNNTTTGSSAPIAVNTAPGVSALSGKTVVAIGAGDNFSSALCSDGSVVTWGNNTAGMLGNNSTTLSKVPVAVNTASGVSALYGKTVVAIATGSYHMCALCSDGSVAAWGQGSSGQMGNNTSVIVNPVPLQVSAASGVSALYGRTVSRLSAGGIHCMALCTDGAVVAWGGNAQGQLGNNTTATGLLPTLVSTASGVSSLFGKTVISISSAGTHNLAVCSDGTMSGWGDAIKVPVTVSSAAVPLGAKFTRAACSASIGTNLAIVALPVPALMSTLAATSVTDTGAALNGTVNANGSNWTVSFEYGLTTAYGSSVSATPATVTGITATPVSAVLTGLLPYSTYHFRVVATNAGGTAYGADQSFDMAPGSMVASFNAATDIPVTADHFTAAGSTISFALNFAPPTGTNLTVINNTGLPFVKGVFSNLAQGQAVALSYNGVTYNYVAHYYGGSGNDLVLVWANNRAYAWGENGYGQIGDGTTTQRNVMVPATAMATGVLAGKTIVALSKSHFHCLVLCSDGTLAAWGWNTYGQLGNGTYTNSSVPVLVNTASGISALYGKTVVSVVATDDHSVALCSDGTVATWGYNLFGQLGNNSIANSNVPVGVNTASGVSALSGKSVVAVAAGSYNVTALCTDGSVASWGYNAFGQLGNSTSSDSQVPVFVSRGTALSGKSVVRVSTAIYHSMALCSDGTVVTWGGNTRGGLGDNTTTSRWAPVAVNTTSGTSALYGKTVGAIATGDNYSMALCTDGTLVSWGDNTVGQLGDGSTTDRKVPVAVSTSSGVSALYGKTAAFIALAQYNVTCICTDGTLIGWGDNSKGNVGNNSSVNSSVPVALVTTPLLSGERFISPPGSASVAQSLIFVAEPQPTLTTLPATAVAGTSATLNGSVNPGTGAATVTFDYGITTAYGSSAVASPSSVAGGSNALVAALVTGLTPGVTYHFRANVAGYVGADQTFTTPSNDATLASLTTSAGTLTPGFASSTFSYVAPDVAAETADLSITATTFEAHASVTVNGTPVTSGSASGPVILGYGLNVINVLVTAQDGVTKQTYTVALNRALTSTISARYDSAASVAVVANGFTATARTVNFALNFAPQSGANLTVVNNTGLGFISGTFDNLAQGQAVALSYNGVTYNYIANYYGGTGNDLVLVWAANRIFGWGYNTYGQIGDGTSTQRNVMVPVTSMGVLAGKTVVSLVQGTGHSLALCTDGTLAAWGNNYNGQLGINSGSSSNVPVAVNTASGVSALSGKTVVAVAAGASHSLALCSDGTLAAWGSNYDGQLGNNSTSDSYVPVAVNSVSGTSSLFGKAAAAVAAGSYHSLALCTDGTMVAWGYNNFGQLGDNTTTQRLVPVKVNTVSGVSALFGKTVTALAAGDSHCLALCTDGTVVAWGYNNYGQVGDNTTSQRLVPTAVNTTSGTSVLAGRPVVAITAGQYYNLALCADGTVAAWGDNGAGQLGDNTTTQRSVPAAVNTANGISALAGRTVVALATGGIYDTTSRALCADGSAAMWGYNYYGDMGNNSTTSSSVPVPVNTSPLVPGEALVSPLNSSNAAATLVLVAEPLPGVATLAATSLTGGSAVLKGVVSTYNSTVNVSFDYGATNAYGSSVAATPAVISGSTPTSVSASLTGLLPLTTYHFRVNDGDFAGNDMTFTTPNNDSSLSMLSVSSGSLTPAFVNSTLKYTHTVDTTTATVSVMPTLSDSNATLTFNGFSIVSGSINALNLNYGDNIVHIVVTAQDGAAKQDYVLNVVRQPPGSISASYATGSEVPLTTNGFTATGSAVNFSLNYAPTTGANLMVVNNIGRNFISGTFDNLAQGQEVVLSYNGIAYHYVANYYGGTGNDLVLVWQNNRLFAWGSNTYGEIGDGTKTNRTQPVTVTSTGVLAGKTIVSQVAGLSHTLVLCSDGTLAAWGENQSGQLGDNTTTSRSTPVLVNSQEGVSALYGRTVVAIAAGAYHCMALCSDGTLVSWGDNSLGQLGDNTTSYRYAPVAVNTDSGVSALYGRTVVAITAGWYFSLALCADGSLVTWGHNSNGQLGNGTTTTSYVPVLVSVTGGVLEGKTVSALAAGQGYCAVLCSDGSLAAWGSNSDGQLGINSTTDSSVPVAVNTASGTSALYGKTVSSLSAGSYHCLALCTDGTAVAWGDNYGGKLGDNTTTQRNVPVVVNAVSGVSALYGRGVMALVAEDDSSLALCSDGSLVAWGANDMGQLGDGTTTNRSAPVLVLNTLAAGEQAASISRMAFSGHSLALVATPPYPTVTTQPATLIAGTSAVLNGTFVAAYNSMSAGFEYGTTTAYGTQVAGTPTPITSGVATPASATLSGLTPGTTYHFRASGTNTAGPLTGSDLIFTTLNNNPALASFGLSGGALSPAFDPSTTDYSVSVPYLTTAITLAPALADAHATMLINGVSFSAGTTSWPIQLLEGSNVITILVTAEDGVTTRAYTVTVTRAAGPSLSSLTLSTGTLSPAFDSNTMNYSAAVAEAMTAITVTPVVADVASIVRVNGIVVSSGSASAPLSLGYGDNAIKIVATAQDGTTQKTYGINVTRAIPASFTASFISGSSVPLAMNGVSAAGTTLNLALNYAPTPGTNLTVVKNTSNSPIIGVFSNLAQGQIVGLVYGGVTYNFMVNYFGGTGNDLVLQWSTNHVYAWGYYTSGQLGTQFIGTNNYYPCQVGGGVPDALTGKSVISLAAGGSHTLALCSDGTVAAWGNNSSGQDGSASSSGIIYSATAVNVVSGISALYGKTVVSIAAGGSHSLALCSDGTVVAWGNNGMGQIGNGSSTPGYTTSLDYRPVAVSVLSGSSALSGKKVVSIAAGGNHSLALCSDGTVVAWGANASGQLGDTTTTQRNFPVAVNAACGISALYGKTVTAISAGQSYSMALCSDGSVVTWGLNSNGQLGDGTVVQRSMPVPVSTASGLSVLSGKTVVMIAAGATHSLALCTDGSIAAWGGNGSTQLGNGNSTQQLLPVAVSTTSGFSVLSGKSVTSIAAGIAHSLASCTDGTMAAWGGPFNFGTLGTGYSNSPPRQIKGPTACSRNFVESNGVFTAAFSGQSALHSLAFVAVPPPAMVTLGVDNITSFTADAKGSVAGSLLSSVYFEYGASTAYGSQTVAFQNGLNGSNYLITGYLSGLQPGTTYHYRVATTSYKGTDQTFTTLNQLQMWKQMNFGTSANTGTTADSGDFDNDGIPNLIEWACNLSPTTRSALATTTATNGTNFEYSYSRSTSAANAGTTFTVEWSDNLASGSWSSTGVVQTVLSDDGTTQQVKAVIPINASNAKFVRLSVTAPP